MIAEAAFGVDVAAMLPDWNTMPVTGDHAYDYLLADTVGPGTSSGQNAASD